MTGAADDAQLGGPVGLGHGSPVGQWGQVVAVSGGTKTVVSVALGLSDGSYIEVAGLKAGTAVLLYPLESDF